MSIRMPVFIACRSQETAERWQEQNRHFPGLDFKPVLGCRSLYRLLNSAVHDSCDGITLFTHDDNWFGVGIEARIHALVDELKLRFPNWAVCGNAGVSYDGRKVYHYLHDPHCGPDQGVAPKPVLTVDGNLILLNAALLRQSGLVLPDLGGFHGYDLVLSLECYRRELLVLADRRLMTMHKSAGDQKGFDLFVKSRPFADYFSQRFINHRIITLNGPVDMSESVDYSYAGSPETPAACSDIMKLFDAALIKSRVHQKPTLTVVCRSILNRPMMLQRAVGSFAQAQLEGGELLAIQGCIVTDKDYGLLEEELRRLRRLYPGLPLDGRAFAANSERSSRVNLILQSLEAIDTDYIWFVDDDDFILPGAALHLGRVLFAQANIVAVGHSLVFDEQWSAGLELCESSRPGIQFRAENIFNSFNGDNHVPVCGCVFPPRLIKNSLAKQAARGDYYEDYFLLLNILNSRRLEIEAVDANLCGVSWRKGDNTINQLDRSNWDFSYATFMGEIAQWADGNPFLWQLGTRKA